MSLKQDHVRQMPKAKVRNSQQNKGTDNGWYAELLMVLVLMSNDGLSPEKSNYHLENFINSIRSGVSNNT